jgi:hypothetical protein
MNENRTPQTVLTKKLGGITQKKDRNNRKYVTQKMERRTWPVNMKEEVWQHT